MKMNNPLYGTCKLFFKFFMLSALPLFFITGKTEAQQTITIPLNNDHDRELASPLGCQPAYNKTQTIYTSSEIGGTPGVISWVAFYVTGVNNPMASTPVVISMKNSLVTSVSSTSFQTASDGATTVFSGVVMSGQLSRNAWVVIPLNTPFNYAGQSLEVFIEVDPGTSNLEDYNAKQFRWSDYTLQTVSQTWIDYATPIGPTLFGQISSYRPNIKFALQPASAMTYISSTTTQPNAIASPGKKNQVVAGIKVEMLGSASPMSLTDIDLNKLGSSLSPNAINKVKVYYTGLNPSFDTSTLFGSLGTSPTAPFTITGNKQLTTGTNYFWVTYDVDTAVAFGDSLDVQCTQLTISGTTQIPSVTNPTGNVLIGRFYNFESTTNQHFVANSLNTMPNQWERGVPVVGPKAFSGNTCWGTSLTGNISRGSNYALSTPSYMITASDVKISYKQWYHMVAAYAVNSTIEYNINNGGWTTLGTIENTPSEISSKNWEDAFYTLPTTVGDKIQFRWHLNADPNNFDIGGEGWYIDDVTFSGIAPINQLYEVSFAAPVMGTTLPNTKTNQIIRVAVAVTGSENELTVTNLNFNTAGSSPGSGLITKAKLYYTEGRDAFDTSHLYGSFTSPSGAFSISGSQSLVNGLNFFWLTYDLSSSIQQNDSIDASCTQITISSVNQTPFNSSPGGNKIIGKLYDFDSAGTEFFRGQSLNQKESEWQKGTPATGPMSAYSGTNCWGTNLISGYTPSSSYALHSPQFIATAPSISIDYAQWYKLAGAYNITAVFQYMVNHSNSWTTLNSLPSNLSQINSANQWVMASAFASVNIGDTVEFRWAFTATNWAEADAGWFIDNVVVSGAHTFNQTYKSNTMTNVAGIASAGAANMAIARMEILVTGNNNPLTAEAFTFNLANTFPVTGVVSSAKVFYTGIHSDFDTLSQFGNTVLSPSGTFTIIDSTHLQVGTNYFWLAYNITQTASFGDTVNASCTQIKINNTLFPSTPATPYTGSIVGRMYHFDTTNNQGFEASMQGSTPNMWQKGTPANVGPTSTPSGNNCWGTVINGNITGNSHYALKTPTYVAQSTTIETSYKQWYRLITAEDIDATFEYQVNNGTWNTLTTLDQSTSIVSSENKWQNALSQVSVNVGDSIRFQWNFNTEPWVGESPGWYIDNFIISGVNTFNHTYITTTVDKPAHILAKGKANQAILQVYIETVGTENLQSVTSLDFNTLTSVVGAIDSAKLYYTGQSPVFNTNTQFGSGIVLPTGSFTITGNQQLLPSGNYFWLTYDLKATAVPNDSFTASCTSVLVNTTNHTPSVTSTPGSLYVGKLYNFDTTHNQFFEVVTLGPNGGTHLWQRGTPSNVGPAAAYSGNNCWATNLTGKYHPTSDFALLTVPFVAQSSTVQVGYKQWYELVTAYNVRAEFQYQLNNNNTWTTLASLAANNDLVNSKSTWENVLTQPVLSAGDTVQFRWRFAAATSPDKDAAGWYIDDFTITGARTFNQSLTNIAVEQLVDATAANASNLTIIRVPVTISGTENPVAVTSINFNTNGSDTLTGLISSAKVYYTGLASTFDTNRQFGTNVSAPSGSLTFTDSLTLPSGVNYFWLTYDVGSVATIGSVLDAEFEKITVSTIDYFATTPAPSGNIIVGELYTFDAPYAQNFTTEAVTGTKNEWQRGIPVGVTSGAYSGTKCWGTNAAAGSYTSESNYALVSAPYIATSTKVTTSFKQWYDIGSAWDVVAEFQYQINFGSWNTLSALSSSGEKVTSNNKWENISRQITVSNGDTVMFRWHFVSGRWGTLSTGWFIDNFIVSSVTKPDVFAPTISYTPLNNINSTANRVLSDFATIHDEGGIDLTTGNRPRMYFKKSSEQDVFGTYPSNNNSGFNGWKYVDATNLSSPFSFTLNYGLLASPLAVNDTLEYFVVAQDLLSIPNTAAFPSEGFSAGSVNTILTSPTTKNRFIITPNPLNGVYSIGIGQPFATITSAASALTQRGVSGPVTFLLTDSVYNAARGEIFPITITETVGASQTNTLTIKPAVGKNITISSTNAVFKLDDADYVTIDGSNASAPTRNLTLQGHGTSAVVWIGSGVNGSHHNTIKNLAIKGSGNTKFGVYAGASGFTSISIGASAPNSFNRIENNSIQSVNIGIAFIGASVLNADIGNKVMQNKIGDSTTIISGAGIFLQKQASDSIIGNTIEHIHATIKGIDINNAIAGIYLYQVKQSYINGNKVSNLVASTNNGGFVAGIAVNGTGYPVTNNIISNNFVADGRGTTSSIYSLSGIDMGDGSGDKVHFNTVSLTGSLLATTGTAAAFRNGNANNIDIRNNVFSINGTSPVGATFYAHDTYLNYQGSTVDYNVLYSKATGSAIASIARGYSTLAAWKSYTLKETNSKVKALNFVSATDLHLAGASIGDTANLKGTPISGFAFDIDGDTRSAIFPYIGADENTITPLPVKLVNFTATIAQNDVVLQWTTSSETNNKGFYVERLTADQQWETVGFIHATDAKTGLKNYRLIDNNPFNTTGATTLYYRLNQMDFDGKTTYSDIVSVTVKDVNNASVTVFPNPFQTNMLVSIYAETDKEAILSAYDIMGKKVLTQVYALQKGANVINIEQSNTWKTGIYFVTLDMGNERKTIKVSKN